MGQPADHPPVLLLLAAFSRHGAALQRAYEKAEAEFGPVALSSDLFDFANTDYYEPSMGHGLKKQFFAYDRLIDPVELPRIKLLTNRWEEELAARGEFAEPRPLNLDPGYLTLAKLVLASTKDHAHRLYLGQGIFGEITLQYLRSGGWTPHPWTFADYRSGVYFTFLDRCRKLLLERQKR